MTDTPVTFREQDDSGQVHSAHVATLAAQPASAAERGAHRFVYLAMLFSIALGLLFASDSLVSYAYDLSQNEWTDRFVSFAEEWQREMENAGLTSVTERIREWVAAIQGG